MYFLKMTKLMFIMRLSISHDIFHIVSLIYFSLGVVIKFLLISSVVQPCRPLIAFIVVMGPQSACCNG